MAWEVERKARIPDPEAIAERLTERFGTPTYSRKVDRYFSKPGDTENRFRLRTLSLDTDAPGTVTWKSRVMDDGMEINEEREFEVSNAADFSSLIGRIGCSLFAVKKKDTRAWNLDHGLLAELSYVDRLAWFLEVEAVIPDTEGVEEAKRRVNRVFQELRIPTSDYEPRAYLSMLASGGL
ncbi:MAG: class IV adenylate cyclase [Spirochaetaceae bacterium]